MGHHHDDSSDAADESNQLLKEQLDMQKRQEALKLRALQQEQFNILSAQTGGSFSGKKPTQADFPQNLPVNNPF